MWLGSLLAVRAWTKKRLLQTLAMEEVEKDDVSLPFAADRPEDREAREVVRRYRRRYFLNIWPDTEFSFKSITGMALELVQEIAQVYHPEDERPELHASLDDLIGLQSRIANRLRSLLDTLPLRAMKGVELQTILFYHGLYKRMASHPGYVFLKRHHLDKVARYAWMLKNIASPWYWGRRAAYASGKEVLARFFLARMATIIGVEAIRLYSGRTPGAEKWRPYQLAMHEMVHLASANGHAGAEAMRFILRFILSSRDLPEPVKLALVEELSRAETKKPVDLAGLTVSERTQVKRWLKKFIVRVLPGSRQKQALQEIHHRLEQAGNDSG